ncbi:serine carboxypeptidase S28-domain-containing protein [Aspergillus karnatakaensis]|uniref:putative serine peptidase, family S28 n=1 Tax=Aspergillus karnatakaensis TaxID=1810916 RepID=UPI003CCE25BC
MRLSPVIAVAAAVLASPVAGFLGMRYDIAKQLQLNAELGIDSSNVVKNQQNFRTISGQAEAEPSPEWVTLPIDHDNSSVGTFQNRFWASDAYYKPGGPVIIYDVGETNGDSSAQRLTADTSVLREMLQEFNAVGIVWEHRYYGESLPYPITNNTPAEYWKYLTTRQALADIPVFAENFTRPNLPGVDLRPAATPWVMIGGSYPGIRAAFSRNKYPETIYAALASSAPVEARIDFSAYYEQIYRGMVANGQEACAHDIRAALVYIDEQLDNPSTAAAIKQLFFGPGAEANSNEDFTTALAGLFGFWQTYGLGPDGAEESLGEFCRYIESDLLSGLGLGLSLSLSGTAGVAAHRGNKYVAERWAAWPIFTEVVNFNMDTNCRGLDTTAPSSCILNKPPTSPDYIAWTWQFCSEWGFYQSNNVGPHSLLSKYQTLQFQQEQCNRLFPEAVKAGLLPPQPAADALNKEFGGWTIRPSNVFFTAGQWDPWTPGTLLSKEEFAPAGVQVSVEIPKCGVKTAGDRVFGYVGENEVHCFDFIADSVKGQEARGVFANALREWLPCFGKGRVAA